MAERQQHVIRGLLKKYLNGLTSKFHCTPRGDFQSRSAQVCRSKGQSVKNNGAVQEALIFSWCLTVCLSSRTFSAHSLLLKIEVLFYIIFYMFYPLAFISCYMKFICIICMHNWLSMKGLSQSYLLELNLFEYAVILFKAMR